jgi:hypothetical protein
MEQKSEQKIVLIKTKKYLLICLTAIITGYFLMIASMKIEDLDQSINVILANSSVILMVLGLLGYVWLSQQLAEAFGENKGFNFVMTIFFPIGTVWIFFKYSKKINELLNTNK